MTKFLVCGGRDYQDHERLTQVLSDTSAEYISQGEEIILIHGGADGADDLAEMWADLNDISVEVYPANWKQHGRAAGPIRNALMLEDGKPDIVIAFPGGRGTANMVKLAKRAGVTVKEIS